MSARIPARIKERLRGIVGRGSLLDDHAGLAAYAYDSSLHPGRPGLVLFPTSTEQVAQIVKLLNMERIPYVARGAGTNLSGGSIASRGGVVIALSGMREIIEINTSGLFARVQPGVTNLSLQEILKEHGCFFAPDPASQRVSTIGGNFAENSGGPHCLKYGVTVNHILGARVVAPDGEILEVGGERLFSPGLDLLGLLVGSEGTLGIATEIVCRILPLPRAVRTMLAIYDSTEDAGRTVSDIIAAGIVPATLEMMDNVVIRAVEEALHAGYPTDAGAVLIIEVDGIEEALAEVIGRIEKICRRNKVREVRIARDEKERDILWAGRRGAFAAVAGLFSNYSVSDGTVPRTELPHVLRRVSEVARKYDLTIGNVFHAGDGNLHPLIFFDARDSDQLERVHRAGKEILVACTLAGGTISGEHGVGSEKIGSMSLVFRPDEIELMRQIKEALDPNDVCNPGKILPEQTVRTDTQLPKHSPQISAPESELNGIPLYSPSSGEELADIVRGSCSGKKTLAAIGSDTLFSRLPYCTMPDVLISTRGLRTIIEHDAENLTVTAEAGISLEELQNELGKKNQFLPLDAPPQATLGGVVSAGLPGLRRHIYGAPRDLVLGLKFVDCFGRTLKAGGKTVKNVAGYDYGKLLVGSWGTLGIIRETTFRLLPLPRNQAAFFAGFDQAEQACEAGARISAQGISPSLLVLLNRQATPPEVVCGSARYLLLCGAEGAEQAVYKQVDEMKEICSGLASAFSETAAGRRYGEILSSCTGTCYPAGKTDSFLSLYISCSLEHVCDAVETVMHIEAQEGLSVAITADLMGGALFVHFVAANKSTHEHIAAQIFAKIRRRLPRSSIVVLTQGGNGGNNAAESEALSFITGGGAPPEWVKLVTRAFDPANRLNPGLKSW